MQQQICMDGFFKGGPKGSHQRMREVSYEPDRIGHGDRTRTFDPHAPRGGIERGKELVGRVGVGLRERIEKRRLAGVGITHQRYRHHATAHSRPTLRMSLTLDLAQSFPQQLDLVADDTAVHFKLRFTRTPHADAPTLTLQVGPHASQAGHQMLQLRELDLELALVAARPKREDIEDQTDTVDHTQLEHTLEVALLGRRQGVIDEDELCAVRRCCQRDLFCLARPDEQGSIRTSASGDDRLDDLCSGAFRQHLEFVATSLKIGNTEINGDNDCPHGGF